MLYHIIKERRDDVRTFRLEVVEVPWCYSNKCIISIMYHKSEVYH